jgi:peptidoglycan/xylan/chitin deacetylase (PgdA/CDA1 family)
MTGRSARFVLGVIAFAVAAVLAPTGEKGAPAASAAAPSDVLGQPVAFGDAGLFGSTAAMALRAPIVGMAATPTGNGYWLVAADGGVFAFGDAGFFGSTAAMALRAPIVGMAAAATGNGYWLVAADGGVFAFGDAGFFGSTAAMALRAPIVGMAAWPCGFGYWLVAASTALRGPIVALAAWPCGFGYWLVAADGGVFAFGDAGFFGSTATVALRAPIVGMAAQPWGLGYWLVAADGGVFAFGDAGFFGSTATMALRAPIVGMAATPSGLGYWLGGADGGIFAFGDAPFFGSMGGQALANPINDIVARGDGLGLWLLPTTPPPPPPAKGPALGGLVISNLSQIPGNLYPPGTRVVALTFDDGPSPAFTPQVLNVLTQNHVPATFQIIGRQGAAYPYLLRAAVADGMTLTNHTWDHVDLTGLAPFGWQREVDQTSQLITSVTGQSVKCLRPPYGATNRSVVGQLAQRGLGELMWDIDTADYLRPPASVIAQRVLSALHPGAIVIMHDGGGDRSQTVAALPAIIQGIRAAGYQLVAICN